jgi:hypothetical protein
MNTITSSNGVTTTGHNAAISTDVLADLLNGVQPVPQAVHNNAAHGNAPNNADHNHSQNRVQEPDSLEIILQTRELLHRRRKEAITFASPIVHHGENAVFFPRTINVIQGKSGVHKSRLAELLCSALLKHSDCTNELLGFSANRFKTYCVLYVDTERNLSEQLPFALQQILRKAGHPIQSDLRNFDCISLLEIEREQRFATLNRYLSESARQHYTQHIFIVLDVATDCVIDFNNPKDSLQFIDMMNRTINTHDVTFLCLIHENPNGEKARGHLGTELMNKASTVVHVGFEKDSNNDDTNVLHIKFLKCRSTARHKPIYAQYSTEEQGLVLADAQTLSSVLDGRRQKASIQEIVSWLEEQLPENGDISKQELFKEMTERFECKERILEDRFKELLDSNYMLNVGTQSGYLRSRKDGRKVMFFFEPIAYPETAQSDELFSDYAHLGETLAHIKD